VRCLDKISNRGNGLSQNNTKENGNFLGVPSIFWTLFSIRTINSVGFSATLPFLGVYLLIVRSVSPSEIGLLYLSTGILSFVSQILSGRLTDVIGPKKVMLLGYLSSIVSSLILGFLVALRSEVFVFLLSTPYLGCSEVSHSLRAPR
jgi:predicted MFS family arabinose efflux permease